ncbi:replication-associated recombination protein A [uncultured Desulfobacter sp.]|uniref:replication-associated recombination protein A n=1 Tax=uncultured Desulfobacter sp. TaxID=240139 RepID=UPI002AAB4DCE|nr:replication-associated recombination protein A [uncultured Desulfobacter sp.]
MDLFDHTVELDMAGTAPLAERMRPKRLEDVVGQEHITGKNTLLERAVSEDRVFSMILWGPPGCGKTTLANVIAAQTKNKWVKISAVLSGVKEVRQIIEEAREGRRLHNRRTLLFVDEIHRFNKSQQDAFLFHVENGLITLIGATTENPSFEVNPALVSRCRVFTLNSLSQDAIVQILNRALTDKGRGLGLGPDTFSKESIEYIAAAADGDARAALTSLETCALNQGGLKTLDVEDVRAMVAQKLLRHDKAGEEHFNLISAFIKSVRGSDPDAAMYWLERMLSAGDDPIYLLRRMIRLATEDIGLADPGALTMAMNADASFRRLGRPEGDGSLYQAAVYLATAPKSNAVYEAQKQVQDAVKKHGALPVPMHIRNAPTGLMKQMGYGKGYKYAHDYKDGYAPQSYLPPPLEGARFYHPTARGYEKTVKQRLEAWLDLKKKAGDN